MTGPRHASLIGRCSPMALCALLALSGCGLTTVEDARDEARIVARDAAAARAGVSAEPGYVTVRRVDRPWVGLELIEDVKAQAARTPPHGRRGHLAAGRRT